MMVKTLQEFGHDADGKTTLVDGFAAAQSGDFDLIFLDVSMPDGNGLNWLPKFLRVASAPEIIIMTGAGDPAGARTAIERGAWSYLEKPHIIRNLPPTLAAAIRYRQEKASARKTPIALKREQLIGHSSAITESLDHVAAAAASDASVLITGETGTGKEIFARTIHNNSRRSNNNFVVVDCASLPETLIESTLFGHTKGAFTGAEKDREGLISLADGGTLFLDEVGELPLDMQKKFLRVLQELCFRPLGARTEQSSNFRLISATNRDLDQAVAAGTFRSDLLFRLKAFAIDLPPLRERTEDIRDLTHYFTNRFCERLGIAPKGITNEFTDHLSAYDWPGNIRELKQTLEQVIALQRHHPTLFARHLPSDIRVAKAQSEITEDHQIKPLSSETKIHCLQKWTDYRAQFEQQYIHDLFLECAGDIKKIQMISGLSRSRIYQLIQRHNIGK